MTSAPVREVSAPRKPAKTESTVVVEPIAEPSATPRAEKANGKPEDVVSPTRCTNCGSNHLTRDYERGELVCDECGLVLEESMIDQGPEWRAFDAEQGEKRARTGAPTTLTMHDKGLTTEIGWRNRDPFGKSIPTRNRAQLYRLRKWQRRIRVSNATERNLSFALAELDRIASSLGLPRNVRETAAMIYRRAVTRNLIRGRSIEGVVAASLYGSCRQCKVPRTLDEIASKSRIGRKEIGRTYRFMTRELQLKLLPTKPQDYIQRFCSELKLKGEIQSRANDILKLATEHELTSGRGPTGVAAAAIYIASVQAGERRTQRDVAEVAGVTEVTIRNRYKELTDKLQLRVML